MLAFLRSQPGGCLPISPEQVPTLAAFLKSVGLPDPEVDRLLFSPGSHEITLSAQALEAAMGRGQSSLPAKASPQNETSPKPPPQGGELTPEAQELRQSPEYREVWQRLSLPPAMLPRVRLALAHLGVSPEGLAHLDEQAKNGDLTLPQVWQIMRQSLQKLPWERAAVQANQSGGETFAPPGQGEAVSVMAEELKEWQQVLLEAGLPATTVDKLLGKGPPADQQELRTRLLSLAPPEETTVLDIPKPLYLTEDMQQKSFFRDNAPQRDRAPLEGQVPREQATGAGGEPPPSLQSGTLPENFGLAPSMPPSPTPAALPAGPPGWLREPLPLGRAFGPEVRESLWSQLKAGIIDNLVPGESQVSLQLNPPEMGQIQLTLNLSGQNLTVTAVASRPEVAELATQGMSQLAQSLANQGLVLTHFQVQLSQQSPALTAVAFSGGKENQSGEGEKRFPPPSRRRPQEVDRFV